MCRYGGPLDPDHASPEELLDDKVWSRLNRVLQLKPKEKVDGKPRPFNASVLSRLVFPLLLTLCSFPILFYCFFYFESHIFVGT